MVSSDHRPWPIRWPIRLTEIKNKGSTLDSSSSAEFDGLAEAAMVFPSFVISFFGQEQHSPNSQLPVASWLIVQSRVLDTQILQAEGDPKISKRRSLVD